MWCIIIQKWAKVWYSSIIEFGRYRNIYFQNHLRSKLGWVHHVLDIYHPYGCHLNVWGREGEEPLCACFVDILPKLLRIKLPSQSLGYLLLQIRNTRCTYFAYLFLNCWNSRKLDLKSPNLIFYIYLSFALLHTTNDDQLF
jgi:hypothetical protein